MFRQLKSEHRAGNRKEEDAVEMESCITVELKKVGKRVDKLSKTFDEGIEKLIKAFDENSRRLMEVMEETRKT